MLRLREKAPNSHVREGWEASCGHCSLNCVLRDKLDGKSRKGKGRDIPLRGGNLAHQDIKLLNQSLVCLYVTFWVGSGKS